MIELGKYNNLVVRNFTDFGLYLASEEANLDKTILLPKNEIPPNTVIGDTIKVFVYKDSEDRDIATTKEVPLEIGQIANLIVKDVTPIGAFVDWGLMKDLLVPFKEQTKKLNVGDSILISLYIDKSNRLCGTMKLYDLLSLESPYKKDDYITGTVYEIIDNFGAFVAIDNKFSGLIPNQELFKKIQVGDQVSGRVMELREDGKLTISLRQKSHIQLDADAKLIMDALELSGGFLPYHDKTDSEVIKDKFQISKNAFKRAIGRLYRAEKIILEENGIKKIQD